MDEYSTDERTFELRLSALDRAITYHSHRAEVGSADDVIGSAIRFERYLKGGFETTSAKNRG